MTQVKPQFRGCKMLMRYLYRKTPFIVTLVLLSVVFLYALRRQPLPAHQKLHLMLDLPRTMDDQYLIQAKYFHHLQSQLETKQYQENETIYLQRKTSVSNFCKSRTKVPLVDTGFIRNQTWYLKQPNILFCGEAKAGSTFWRRAFEVLRRNDSTIISPYQLAYDDFWEEEAKLPVLFNDPYPKESLTKFLNSTLKFVFARDPCKRIFSTYVDKVLAPNGYFWDLGEDAIRQFRSENENDYGGSDLTFEEFIKYLNTYKPDRLEKHVRPVAFSCDACDINYDVIGKVETFQTDVRYILKKIGSFGRDIVFQDMELEFKIDYIVIAVTRAFELIDYWHYYISIHAAYQRLWRQLQISGLIDKTDRYPLTASESNNISVTEYLDLALSAFTRSSPAAKGNKKEALLQAYSTVSQKDMEALGQLCMADFEMYDYEQRPEYLFHDNRHTKGDFDYFDVMKLI